MRPADVLWRRRGAGRDNDCQTGPASFDCHCTDPYHFVFQASLQLPASLYPLCLSFSVALSSPLVFLFLFFAPFLIILCVCSLSLSSFLFIFKMLYWHLCPQRHRYTVVVCSYMEVYSPYELKKHFPSLIPCPHV